MKVDTIPKQFYKFEDLSAGDVFVFANTDSPGCFMKTYNNNSQHINTVNLINGYSFWTIDDVDVIPMPYAKVVFDK